MSDTTALTTGATDEQIEAAAERRYYRWRRSAPIYPGPPTWEECPNRAGWIEGATVDASLLVPPGFVIAPAADVLTAEQRAAIGRAWTLIAAMRDVAGYDDLSQAIPTGVCPVCETGVEDPSSLNADRATAYRADMVFTNEDADILARLAAGGDGR